MLSKLKSEQTKSRSGLKRRFKLFSKMTRSGPVSPYQRMESEVKKKGKICNLENDKIKDKENIAGLGNKEVKDKKTKKRSWKRIRQAALTTCRYIGLGVAHMSPAAAYSSPEYSVDPKCWNKSFSSTYKPKNQQPTPHWSNNFMFAGW